MDMEAFLKFVEIILIGDIRAIVLLLVVIILGLIWDRIRLEKQINTKDERISKILDDYHKGNLTLAEALVNVRLILYEIKSKL